jgi:hypothetical protein
MGETCLTLRASALPSTDTQGNLSNDTEKRIHSHIPEDVAGVGEIWLTRRRNKGVGGLLHRIVCYKGGGAASVLRSLGQAGWVWGVTAELTPEERAGTYSQQAEARL